MRTMFDFADAQVLVTGGTAGIGLATARLAAEAGASVTITGTRESATDYEEDLSGLTYRRLQLTEPGSVGELVDGLDRLDLLVNNAGANMPGGADEWQPDVFGQSVEINLLGPYRVTAACRHLLSRGSAVVNVASMTALLSAEMVPGYAAAKAAVIQLTKTLACAWARDGIRVNAVAPGVVETSMTAPLMEHDFLLEPMLLRTPQSRVGNPQDIASVILFLASEASGFLTGQTVVVDGGYTVKG